MRTFEAALVIAASRTSIWAVLSDVMRWHEWTPTVTKIESLDSPQLAPGHRFKVLQPKLRPAVWTVTTCDNASRFVWQARSLGLEMIADHLLEQLSDGTTRLVLRFSFSGVLGGVLAALMKDTVVRYLTIEAESLQRRVADSSAKQKGAGFWPAPSQQR